MYLSTFTGNPATLTTTPLCKGANLDCLVFRFYTLSDVNWWKTAADGMVADAAKAGIVLNLALYGTTQMNNQIWWPMDYDIWLWDWMFTPAADPSTGILAVETCENLINGTSNDNGFCLIDPNDGHWVYDDIYNRSVRETNPELRRDLTNQMQSILYQYGGYSLPFYRKEVYAMNELRWTHWGDWASQPGLPEDVGTNALIGQYVWPVDHKPPQVSDLPAYTGVAGALSARVRHQRRGHGIAAHVRIRRFHLEVVGAVVGQACGEGGPASGSGSDGMKHDVVRQRRGIGRADQAHPQRESAVRRRPEHLTA